MPDHGFIGPPIPPELRGDAGGHNGAAVASNTSANLHPDSELGQVASDVIDDDRPLPQAALAYVAQDADNDNVQPGSVPNTTLLTQDSGEPSFDPDWLGQSVA